MQKRPIDLGLVGLAQFRTGIFLFLVAGQGACASVPRKLLITCYFGFSICSGLLLFTALRGMHAVYPIYSVVVLIGIVRSFNGPVSRALLPQLVPEEHFQNAVAWNGSFNQGGTILGPTPAGLIYALYRGPSAVYTMAMLAAVGAVICMGRIKLRAKARPRGHFTLKTVLAGLHDIRERKVSLD